MKVFLAVVILAGIQGSLLRSVEASAPDNLPDKDYDVYSEVLRHIYMNSVPENDRVEMLVIQEKTSLQNAIENSKDKDLDGLYQTWKWEGTILDKEMFNKFKLDNEEAITLKGSFDIPIKYVVVSKADLSNAFGDKSVTEAWESFHSKYPNSSGIITLSRVGFNKRGNEALVYIKTSCGPMCADGKIAFLIKDKGVWKTKKIFELWVV